MPSGTKAARALIGQYQLAYVQKIYICSQNCGTKLLLFVLYFFYFLSSGEQYLL